MKIAIIPNLTRVSAGKITKEIISKLKELHVDVSIAASDELTDFACDVISDIDFCVKNSDIVIAVGGDGSIIHAAKAAVKYNKAILGINAGHLAFMAGLEKDELSLLNCLIDKSFNVDKRMMFDVFSEENGDLKYLGSALNDITIARGRQIKLIHLDIFCDGQKLHNYYSDGIIISTPTGSTAYSLSAGGPVVDPIIECITLTPICTHSLFARSVIFGAKSVLTVSAPEAGKEEIGLSIDGEDIIEVKQGMKIIIRKSDSFADFIRIKNDSFLDILNSKLTGRRV